MYEVMGFREGVLVLPNDRPLPIRINYAEMSPDSVPEMRISVIQGSVGRHLIEDYERRQRSRGFLTKPFLFDLPKLEIKKVIFNDPATIVIWSDDTKTVVKCQEGDTYSKELGLAMCISKKFLGNKGNFNEAFKKWIPDDEELSIEEMRDKLNKFCNENRSCSGCILNNYRCGMSVHFKTKNESGYYDMTDDEIRDAYKKVFK